MKKIILSILMLCIVFSTSLAQAELPDFSALLPTLDWGISREAVEQTQANNLVSQNWNEENKSLYLLFENDWGKHNGLYYFEDNKLNRYRYLITELDISPNASVHFIDLFRNIVAYYENSLQQTAYFDLSFRDLASFDSNYKDLPVAFEKELLYFYSTFNTDTTKIYLSLEKKGKETNLFLNFKPLN